jgi:hypothetical protein
VTASGGFSIAHMKELIIEVQCMGKDLIETAQRLKANLEQKHTS